MYVCSHLISLYPPTIDPWLVGKEKRKDLQLAEERKRRETHNFQVRKQLQSSNASGFSWHF
jgi:hypothetical protein